MLAVAAWPTLTHMTVLSVVAPPTVVLQAGVELPEVPPELVHSSMLPLMSTISLGEVKLGQFGCQNP